jgi:hypothetical protein
MIKIYTLEELMQASLQRKSVTCPNIYYARRLPASWVISMQGREILKLIKAGLFIYEKKSKE